MVVLVVCGRYVPSLIQSQDILLIAGIISAGADLSFAVAYLHQEDMVIGLGIPVGEIGEVAEGISGMVELAE